MNITHTHRSIAGSQPRIPQEPMQSGLPAAPFAQPPDARAGDAGLRCYLLCAGHAQDREREIAGRDFMDCTQGLAGLGFVAPGERVMVPREAVGQVNQAIDVLVGAGFRAGQAVPDGPARAALVTLHNLMAIRDADFSASCEACGQAPPARQEAVDANRDGAPSRSRWRLARWSCPDIRKAFPRNFESSVLLACLGVQFWIAVEYILSAKGLMARNPDTSRWLVLLQVGQHPMGAIPALIWIYLKFNNETPYRRRVAGREPLPHAPGPHNV